MAKAPLTRASLLERLRDLHDEAAWVQFVHIYAPLVHGYLCKQGLQEADAADLTQEVLQAAVRALPRLEYEAERGSFRGWLFTVVRNKLRNFRKRRRECGRGDTETVQLLHAVEQGPTDDAWERDYRRRVFAWAADLVHAQVSESNWQAFWLVSVEGKTATEAARALGMSLTAVYTAKSRVLARIKELIEQVQEDWTDAE